jgi:hypothetical protein
MKLREKTMGESESFHRQTFADGRVTVAGDRVAVAETLGAGSADPGPADLGTVSGDGTPATLGTGVAASDATQQGPADLAAAPGASATASNAADSVGSHAKGAYDT